MSSPGTEYRHARVSTPPGYAQIVGDAGALERLTALRQYQGEGKRAPHKPLLVLLALGQLTTTGSSLMSWSVVQQRLGALLDEFGPSASSGATSAAYPFTRLRNDGVWHLSRDVPNDNLGPLNAGPIEGQFTSAIEQELRSAPDVVNAIARSLVENQFPLTIAPDVLTAVGLDADVIFGSARTAEVNSEMRRRDANWRRLVIAAWDRSCAFCGYDGSLFGVPVALEAAHVHWFNFGGPDELDNGLALCSLHHKLLDRGAIGFRDPGTIDVSDAFTAVGESGRATYALHGRELRPRPGTKLPASEHIDWHREQVFKGQPLATA
jgi:putative restriction endonuclease